jgi:MoxR-like ATPase
MAALTITEKIVPYTGEVLKDPARSHKYIYHFDQIDLHQITKEAVPDADEENGIAKERLDPYLPDETLKEVIELMQILERPLLLRGEPGCGKTRVAQAYAYERYKDEPEGYRRYYYEWHVKSTSKAHEGLYTIDHIARLRDANAAGKNTNGQELEQKSPEQTRKEYKKYRQLGPLGKAFIASEPGKPAILLIDEIDKADIDFPNDLLLELDEMRFVIKETGEEITPKSRPLIFITSNQERELPQAFLRRCLFHFIQFPDRKLLQKIMLANFPAFKEHLFSGGKFVITAVDRFRKLRDELQCNPTANKNVTTSELKDWMGILAHFYQQNAADEKIDVRDNKLPFHTALLKTENDLKSVGKFEAK